MLHIALELLAESGYMQCVCPLELTKGSVSKVHVLTATICYNAAATLGVGIKADRCAPPVTLECNLAFLFFKQHGNKEVCPNKAQSLTAFTD